jgi:hypothetical protein
VQHNLGLTGDQTNFFASKILALGFGLNPNYSRQTYFCACHFQLPRLSPFFPVFFSVWAGTGGKSYIKGLRPSSDTRSPATACKDGDYCAKTRLLGAASTRVWFWVRITVRIRSQFAYKGFRVSIILRTPITSDCQHISGKNILLIKLQTTLCRKSYTKSSGDSYAKSHV